MDKRIKIVLPEKKYAGASATDQNEKVSLDASMVEFVEDDRNILLNLNDQFNLERQTSEQYRIYGKITPYFSNAYSGTTDYYPLLDSLYLVTDPLISDSANFAGFPPYNEFAFIRTDVTRDVTDMTNTITEVVGNKHIEIFPYNAHDYNWNTYLSYVYDMDGTQPMGYTLVDGSYINFTASDGIPINITFDTLQRICICESPVPHGLSENEYASINGILVKVDSVGNEIYGSDKTIFNVQLLEVSGTTINEGLNTFKRVLDPDNVEESTSSYYVHKNKIISNDFVLDKCGFEDSIFADKVQLNFENPDGNKEVYSVRERSEVLLFHYTQELSRLGYVDNFGNPISEIYVSIINRNGMGFFDYPPKVGWAFNFHDDHADLYFSGNTSIETGITYTSFTNSGITFECGNQLNPGDVLTGAFVEYNKYEIKERIISEASHRLAFDKNIFDYGQDNQFNYLFSSENNLYGYFYQPHNRIQLKAYSSYIEESETNDIYNFPSNAIYFIKDNVWRWRELYDDGFIDDNGVGVNFPFINGVHYIKFNIPFYIRSEFHAISTNSVVTPFANRNLSNGC